MVIFLLFAFAFAFIDFWAPISVCTKNHCMEKTTDLSKSDSRSTRIFPRALRETFLVSRENESMFFKEWSQLDSNCQLDSTSCQAENKHDNLVSPF